jgi:hypothetical protein
VILELSATSVIDQREGYSSHGRGCTVSLAPLIPWGTSGHRCRVVAKGRLGIDRVWSNLGCRRAHPLPPSSPSMCPPVLPFGEQALKNSDAQDI